MSAKSILFDTIRFSTRKYVFENKDEGSYGSNQIGFFDNRIGIGTTLPAQNYICTIQGDTLIRGNLTATSLNYVTSNLSYLEVKSTGGYPALDLIQTGSDPFLRMLSSSNNPNSVVDIVQKDGNIGIGTSIAYEKLVVQGNIVASNIRLLGSFVEKKALQLKPVQQTFVVETYLQSNFSVFTEGIYDGSADNTAVYLDGYKLAYSNLGATDYTVTPINDYAGNQTEYIVSLTKQVSYGTIVDISVWPYYLSSSEQALQPGWAVQNITSTFFSKNPNNDVYILHNIGVGEMYPSAKLHIKQLAGETYKNVYITNSNNDPLFVMDDKGSIGIGTSIPSGKLDVRGNTSYTGTVTVTQSVTATDLTIGNKVGIGTLTSRQTLDVIGTTVISGNLGVGFSNPIHKFAVEGNAYMSGNLGIGTFQARQLVDIQGGNMIVSGSFGIGTTAPLRSFHVEGISYFGANVGVGTTLSRQRMDVQGDLISSGNIGVGTVSPYLPLFVMGNGYFSGNLGIGTTLTRNPLDIIGNTILQGNLGIGTRIPQYALHVLGGSYTSGNVGVGTTLARQLLDVQGSAILSGNLGIGTALSPVPLYVLGQAFLSGNVGIGTTLPVQLLHVQGGSSIFGGNVGIGTTLPRQLVDIVGGNMTVLGNVGIGTVLPQACLDVKGGSTGLPPVLVRSGAILTTPVAGTIEYDGTVFYETTSVTHGRAFTPNIQFLRLGANGPTITSTASLFGTTTGITLAASTNYEIEYHLYLAKATSAGTVTFSLLFSGTSTSIQLMNATYIGSPPTGVGIGTNGIPQMASYMYVLGAGQTTFTFPTTNTIFSGVNHYFTIRVLIENGSSSGSITLQASTSAGSITLQRGSYYKVTNLPAGNVGAFV